MDFMDSVALAALCRDTILSLELSWMGPKYIPAHYLRAIELSSHLGKDAAQESESEEDLVDDAMSLEQEYLDLIHIPEDAASSSDSSIAESDEPMHHLSVAFAKKERECEHLRQIIKELVDSRAKIARTSAEVQHRYCALQAEFCKARKVADLARTVSQQHMQRHIQVKKEVQDSRARAYRAEKEAAELRQQNAELKADSAKLKRRVSLLENLHLWENSCNASCFHNLPYNREVALY